LVFLGTPYALPLHLARNLNNSTKLDGTEEWTLLNLEEEFDRSWQEESRRHAATTIRNEVGDWCESKRPIAEKRWMWELLQNAIDTAKEHGVSALDICIELKDGNLVVRHNGGNFLLKEIIALVSGGTSKYFGREMIGKFGKGFLVTHVVSKQVTVQGLMTHAGETRPFRIRLDRSGDESKIEQNINECKKQLSETSQDSAPNEQFETVFTFIGADRKAIDRCKELECVLPYIMTFNPLVNNLRIDLGEENIRGFWRRGENKTFVYSGSTLDETCVTSSLGNITCVRVGDEGLKLAVQLKSVRDRYQVVDTRHSPCLYYSLPLYDSDAIILSYAANAGGFSIDTDRAFVNPVPENSRIASKLPDLLAILLDYLISIDAENLHLLAHIDLSKLSEERKNFLKESLASIPEKISPRHFVSCKNASLAPSSVHIPVGDYLQQHIPDLIHHVNLLLTQCYSNVPEQYQEWEQIAKEWSALGVNLQTHNLENLLDDLSLDLVKVEQDSRKEYVISLIRALILAQQVTKSIPKEITGKKILLNQKLELVAPQDANIDFNVKEKLKNVAQAVGWDIRGQMLDVDQLQEGPLKEFISNTLCSGRDVFTSDLVLKRLWEEYVSPKWKENQGQPGYKKALLELVIWLMLNKNSDDLRSVVNPSLVPIFCDDGKFRNSADIQSYPFLWPQAKWKKDLKNFGMLLPHRWIVSGEYLTILPEDEQNKFLEALSGASIAFQEPCFVWPEKHLDQKDADSLSFAGKFPTGANVGSCADLIGLQDITSAAAGAKDLVQASRILEFILGYVLSNDDSWKSPVNLGDKSLYPCYWLAVLKTKDWVSSIDGRHLEPLSKENLERLLLSISSFKLTEPTAHFLAKHFEMSLPGILALQLKTMSPSDQRIVLVDKLMALPSEYVQKITDEVKNRLEIIQTVRRNQRIGRIVEKIVKEIFGKEGFKTEWTGIGSDFKLLESDDVGYVSITQVGNTDVESGILIEVKSTSTEMVRLTLTQSKKAVQQKARYILCVADLSSENLSIESDEEIPDGLIESVRHSLKFVVDIAERIETAHKAAESLQDYQIELKDTEISPGIAIRFEESQIRLGVMKQIWGTGCSLEEVVSNCRNILSHTV
jgi:hypothetical protein